MRSLLTDVSGRWLEAMRRGDFESAWQQTDRLELPRRNLQKRGNVKRDPHHLTWNGESFDGKDILIRCQHGLGDSIQFLRYCPLIKKVARRVHVEVQPALLELFQGMDGIDRLADGWNDWTENWHGVEIECMELAYAFRDTTLTLPRAVPYLPIERLLKTRPRLNLPISDCPKVGLIWASSEWDSERSLSPSDLMALAHSSDAAFFSFQQGRPPVEISSIPFPVIDISPFTQNIADAALGLLSMDLVITVDCMMAHLAGALGRPVLLVLKREADWRWMNEGTNSPWYPTIRLFRQPVKGDWKTPVEQIAAFLADSLESEH